MGHWFTKKERLLAGTIVAGACALGLASPASAQQADAAASAEEEIVVTGSRIARANLTEPTAVTTIDREVIELSGMANAAEILRQTPAFGISAVSTLNSNFNTAGAGINTAELRNLTENRTLILVNSRRVVPGVTATGAVDLNSLPVDMIERVEVITGGASAVYGADALAGVVNFILRDDFEGAEYRYQYGESGEGDDVRHRASLLLGGNFAEGRGNAVINAAYTQDQGVLARDRANTAIDDLALCVANGAAPDPENCQTPVEPFFSGFSERGRFFDFSGENPSLTLDDNGNVVPFSSPLHGFNRQQFRRYSTPLERFLFSAVANYEIAPSIETFFEGTYANTRAKSELEPFPHEHLDLAIDGISCANPFVPAVISSTFCGPGPGLDGVLGDDPATPTNESLDDSNDTVIPYARRMTEIGARGSEAHRNMFRLLAGFRGDFADDRFDWEAYYAYGRAEDDQQSSGQINVSNMREALNAVDGDGDPLTFDPVCANPVAVTEGCVPINLFGRGSISPAAAVYVNAPAQRQSYNQQELVGAVVKGPLVELPAGPVQFVLGAEWRREYAQDVPDALTQSGQNAGNKTPPTFGGYHVGEIFTEVEVPLLSKMTLAHDLSVGGAYRWSDYSTLGETEAYTGHISWSPVEPLRFRAQYARAVRAPNIGELFAPAVENFAPVSDPCNGVTAATTGDVAANCRSIPAVAARIAATGSFTLSQAEIQGTGGFTGGGNPNLKQETSDSYYLGAVFHRDLGADASFALSVDYFNIEIVDLIAAVPRQTAIDECFNVSPAQFPNQFCALLGRDTDGPAFQLGELTEVNSSFINDGELKTEGVDVSLRWSFGLSDWFESAAGNVSLRANYTYLIAYDQTQFGVLDDQLGEVGISQHEWQGAVVYSVGPFMGQWQTTYVGDAVPDNDNPAFNFSVGDYVTHDLRLGYDIFENANIYFGSNNILDAEAPTILSGVPGNTTGTDTSAAVYNPIGRTFYAGIRLRY